MSIAPYIKDIGRGREGARSLTREQAYDLMSQVLDGRVTDLEIGAFALAMRIKGETSEELAGFLEAAEERCIPIRAEHPVVVLPSYNGSRKLPNLTALLALLLAQEGVAVLVHGPQHDANRVTTAEIFRDLGLPCATSPADINDAWSRHEPVFVRTELMCPPLARLLDVRRVVGLRNSGHTVAKLLAPMRQGSALRVVNYTHPEYAVLQAEFLALVHADAMLMRGTEGEPVADVRRAPRLEVFVSGVLREDLSRAAQEGVLTELPVLPRSNDAATTALYIQSVVSGAKPAPTPILQQVDSLVRTLAVLARRVTAERSA
jgi:anthranilate phosphoribosyltransferase